MKHRWVLVLRDNQQVPEKLSDHLQDQVVGQYRWCKIENGDGTVNYTCFYHGKQIDFIPIDWLDNEDKKYKEYWDEAKRFGYITVRDIMGRIMNRHERGWQPLLGGG